MPYTRKQKAREKRSRLSDVMSDMKKFRWYACNLLKV